MLACTKKRTSTSFQRKLALSRATDINLKKHPKFSSGAAARTSVVPTGPCAPSRTIYCKGLAHGRPSAQMQVLSEACKAEVELRIDQPCRRVCSTDDGDVV